MSEEEKKKHHITFGGIICWILAVACVATVGGLWLTAYAPHLDPRTAGWISLSGYAFPLVLALTIAWIVVWVFVKWKYLVIPVAGLLGVYDAATLYCPFFPHEETPEGTLKVLSYNTDNFGRTVANRTDGSDCDAEGNNIVAKHLADSEADIVCLQESGRGPGYMDYLAEVDSIYNHRDFVKADNGAQLWIYSKHPVLRSQDIDIDSPGNMACAFWVDINGRTVVVINTHLQTTGLSVEQREEFSHMIHGQKESHEIESASRGIVGSLLQSARLRAAQAEKIARFIEERGDTPVVVCGDFNDIPQSFAHRTIARNLTDCYQAAGRGPGYSFKQYSMRVRIDNILCSRHFTPYECEVDNSIFASDHFPISCRLAWKE